MPVQATSPELRFWSKVDRSGPDECWLWNGARLWRPDRSQPAYGVLWVDGRNVSAHRFAYSLLHGPVPDGLWVLHHCDNPPCVNPAHLYAGTVHDNASDRVQRGRAIGNHRALTPEQVSSIRREYAAGVTYRRLGAIYGVSPTTVAQAERGLGPYREVAT